MNRHKQIFLGVCLCGAIVLSLLLKTESGSRTILTSLTILISNNSTINKPRAINTSRINGSHPEIVKSYDDASPTKEKGHFGSPDDNASFEEEAKIEEDGETENTTPTKKTEKIFTTRPSVNASKTDGMVEVLHNKEQFANVDLTSHGTITTNQLSNDNMKTTETPTETYMYNVFNSNSSDQSECSPSNSVVYIKTHKTGSTTLGHIVNRYGDARNLSFVFNKHSPNNGHLVYLPITAESPKRDFLPPIGVQVGAYSKYKYDLIAVHIRYNRKPMDTFMKPDAKYITIVRDPGHQFESAFTHFQMDDAFLPAEKRRYETMSSRIKHFLSKPDFYRERLRDSVWDGAKGLRWFYAKNNQMFDLGLDHAYHNNKKKVAEYIERLDKEMALVLITEYFDESMVLLKHTLCWSMDDIIYIAKNVRPHPAEIGDSLRQKMRQWNSVDTQLYEYFNNTLWRKIEALGPAFDLELARFKAQMTDVFETCVGSEKVNGQGHYFHWIEYKQKKDSGKLCRLLAESKRTLFFAIWKKQVPPKPKFIPSKPKSIVDKKPAAPKPPSDSAASSSASKNALPKAIQDRLVKPEDLLAESDPAHFQVNKITYKDANSFSNTGTGSDNPDGESSYIYNDQLKVDQLPATFVNTDPKKPAGVKAVSSYKFKAPSMTPNYNADI